MVDYLVKDKVFTCSFFEKMDTNNCLKCKDDVYAKVHETKLPVVFDMKDVTYVSSTFLTMCVHVIKEKGHENFKLINTPPEIKRVFKIAGFDKYITVE